MVFEVEVGHEDVEEPVVVEITPVGSHAGLGLAICAEGDAAEQAVLDEPAVPVVAVQEVPRRVVGHVGVGVAIVVVVAEDDAEPLAVERVRHASLCGDVRECAVAGVQEQGVLGGVVDVGVAIGAQVAARVAAELVVVPAKVDVVGDVQVEVAIGVDVGPGR